MKIIVAIDDSGCSKVAVRSVLEREWAEGSEVRLLNVIEPLNFMHGTAWDSPDEKPVDLCKKLLEESERHSKDLVSSLSKHFYEKFGEENVSSNVLMGEVISSINSEISDWQADLVVVGSHGKSGIDELLLGSVSRKLLFTAPCSVQIVKLPPYRVPPISKELESPENVLVPVDSSRYSEIVIDSIMELRWPKSVKFMVLHVVRSWAYHIPSLSSIDATEVSAADKDSLENANKLVSKYATRIGDAGISKSITAKVVLGDPRKEILRYATDWPADLIVMGSHGRGTIMRNLLGSVSEAVSHRCWCPVQIVKLKEDG